MDDFLEVNLIENIQDKVLKTVNIFRSHLKSFNTLDHHNAKTYVENFFWKGGKEIPENQTLYSMLSNSIVESIIRWRDEKKESDLSKLSIWVSYNSKLMDDDWESPKRVIVEEHNHSQSYVCDQPTMNALNTKREKKQLSVERKRDLGSIWFEFLKNSFYSERDEEVEVIPSLHYYFTNLKPRKKNSEKPIHTIAIFARENCVSDNHEELIKQQENNMLSRSCRENEKYIDVLKGETLSSLQQQIYKQLFEDVDFLIKDTDGSETDSEDVELLIKDTDSSETNLNESSNAVVLTEEDKLNWTKRYVIFLQGLILGNIKENLDNIKLEINDKKLFDALKKIIINQRNFLSLSKVTGRDLYECITNISIDIPNSEENLGSIIIFTDKVLNPKVTRVISTAVWAIFAHLRDIEDSIISTNNFRKHTIRSAIAAIMGRNMSHNIGSHVLWGLSQELKNFEIKTSDVFIKLMEGEIHPAQVKGLVKETKDLLNETAFLTEYLQRRMDFIAQITTSPMYWCQSMKLSNVIEHFAKDQKLIKKNITLSYSEDLNLSLNYNEISKIDVDIPGGIIGTQAFYSILENIIRNAIKHGNLEELKAEAGDKKHLSINISVEDFSLSLNYIERGWSNNFYKLTITENIPTEKKTSDRLNELLEDEMIERNGTVKTGAWGLKEMKICASYLRRINQQNIDLYFRKWKGKNIKDHPPLIYTEIKKDDKNSDKGSLKYTLYLLKNKFAAIVGKDIFDENHKIKFESNGVDLLNEEEFEKILNSIGFRHDFIVMSEEIYTKFFVKGDSSLNELPFRLFIISDGENEKTNENDYSIIRITLRDLKQFTLSPDRLKFFLWRKWIETFFDDYSLHVCWSAPIEHRKVEDIRFYYSNEGDIFEDNDIQIKNKEKKYCNLLTLMRETSDVETLPDQNPDFDKGIGKLLFDHTNYEDVDSFMEFDAQNVVFHELISTQNIVRDKLKDMFIELLSKKDPSNLTKKREFLQSVFLMKEAASITVGVLDNRIFTQGKKPYQGLGKYPRGITSGKVWEKRKVFFFDTVKAAKDFEKFIEEDLSKRLEKCNHSKYDFLILHQGDLDIIESKIGKDDFNRLWYKLSEKAKHIVIVTGRGSPQFAVDKNLRWIGYSALANQLFGKSKLELVDTLYSIRASAYM